MLAKHQKLGDNDEQILSPQHSEEPNPADTLISDNYLQNGETIHFCFLHLLKFVVSRYGSPTKDTSLPKLKRHEATAASISVLPYFYPTSAHIPSKMLL